jgi:hypothetical protein
MIEEHTPHRREFLTGICAASAAGFAAAPVSITAGEVATGRTTNPRLFSFVGGASGPWKVVSSRAIAGDPLPEAERLEIVPGTVATPTSATAWVLQGVTSNERYVTRSEKTQLMDRQVPLGRQEASHLALIPIRKTARWWGLTQEERRAIFEEQSRHIAIGLKYLPAIARRLHHCRDLGEEAPFDFLTLFDYSLANSAAFDDLLAALRETEEWKFVEREVDLRLVRDSTR